MSDLDPAEALTTCERALRQLFGLAYSDAFGSEWLSHIASSEKLESWCERRDAERRSREKRGVLQVDDTALAYAEFYDLCAIAEKHWGPLGPALGKQSQTLPLLHRFNRLRNTVAHSRPLLSFEADLLSGIAGEIRNRVTVYMTKQDPAGDHYARIESVTDSFGRVATGEGAGGGNIVMEPDVRVQVGDVITFDCEGHDPKGRALSWVARVNGVLMFQREGNRVRGSWRVQEDHVGQRTSVSVKLASDSPYRRHGFGEADDGVLFAFNVEPPYEPG